MQSVAVATKRLEATIDTLLAVARKEIDPSSSSVNLPALAAEIPGVDVTVGDDVSRAEGDQDIVRRALAPLVENAQRHARDKVWMEISEHGGIVRLEVHDDGPGIETGLGDDLFEPGVRGAGAPADGAGLGLPLSRRLARACGGDVSVGAGPGSCFVLELPAV